MFIQSGKYRFAIDTKQIYQLRVAACSQHWQLELSSKNGTALVILLLIFFTRQTFDAIYLTHFLQAVSDW